jgi:indolepyruvate ferredoxin oxidoreductase alpha subunit
MGKQTVTVDPLAVAKACGVQFVREVDPFDLSASIATASEALQYPGPALIVMRQPCATLLKHTGSRMRFAVNSATCTNCGICIRKLGCPALVRKEGKVLINDSCTGCGICAQVCPSGSIAEVQAHEN